MVDSCVFLAKSINLFSFWVPRHAIPYLGLVMPTNAFAEIRIHHLVQLSITVAFIGVLVRRCKLTTWDGFGFSTANWRPSLRDAGVFVLIWALIQFGAGWLLLSAGMTADPGFEMDATNLAGMYLFQLLLSGPGEEPLYRGLVLVTVYRAARPVFGNHRVRMAATIFVTTAVFMFEHINFSIRPLSDPR